MIKISILSILIITSCNQNDEIIKLLSSDETNDIVAGAYKAGETHEKKFVPFLLKDAYDPSMSTDLFYKGITVYQAKMTALEKILNVKAPKVITYQPDSAVLKYFMNLTK